MNTTTTTTFATGHLVADARGYCTWDRTAFDGHLDRTFGTRRRTGRRLDAQSIAKYAQTAEHALDALHIDPEDRVGVVITVNDEWLTDGISGDHISHATVARDADGWHVMRVWQEPVDPEAAEDPFEHQWRFVVPPSVDALVRAVSRVEVLTAA